MSVFKSSRNKKTPEYKRYLIYRNLNRQITSVENKGCDPDLHGLHNASWRNTQRKRSKCVTFNHIHGAQFAFSKEPARKVKKKV